MKIFSHVVWDNPGTEAEEKFPKTVDVDKVLWSCKAQDCVGCNCHTCRYGVSIEHNTDPYTGMYCMHPWGVELKNRLREDGKTFSVEEYRRKAEELGLVRRWYDFDDKNPIRTIRTETGLTQAAFGEELGIPRRTIEDWEAGKRECPSYVVDLLAFRVRHDEGLRKDNRNE